MHTKVPRKRAHPERRVELKSLLLKISIRATKAGTLTSLAKAANKSPAILSEWIKQGEVPPYAARQLLNLPNANTPGAEQIDLIHLTPSLF